MSYSRHVKGLATFQSVIDLVNYAREFHSRRPPTMESVKIVVLGKPVFLLTGAKSRRMKGDVSSPFEVEAPEKLLETARRNPDAVAFGFVAGSWVAAA
jgi:hypothetical protein